EISQAVSDALGIPPDLVEVLPPQSIPKTSSGKLRRSETQRLFLEGKLGKKQPAAWVQIAKLAAGGAAPQGWSLLKRGLQSGVGILYGAYALAAFTAVLVPLWMLVSLTHNRQRAARFTHVGARLMLLAAGVPV